MDRQVIDQKLESLRRCLSRIESKMPFDAAQLAGESSTGRWSTPLFCITCKTLKTLL